MKVHQENKLAAIRGLCRELDELAQSAPDESCPLLYSKLDEIAKLAVSVEIVATHLRDSLD